VIRDAWDVVDLLRRRPSAATLAWAAREVGPGARVVTWRRLTGGIASSVHQLRVVDAKSSTHRLVLKRWLGEDQAGALAEFERETTALVALERTDVPAPRVVASSPEAADGSPAVLMTRVRRLGNRGGGWARWRAPWPESMLCRSRFPQRPRGERNARGRSHPGRHAPNCGRRRSGSSRVRHHRSCVSFTATINVSTCCGPEDA
jgi:hypothetical protein